MRRRIPAILPRLSIDRRSREPIERQIVRQIAATIRDGEVRTATFLPSTRALARRLGVCRNAVLTAYDQLACEGLVQSRRGSGTRVAAGWPLRPPVVDVRRLMRQAHYPARTIALRDPDGNAAYINCPEP